MGQKNLIESDLQCNLWLCPPYLPIIDLLKKMLSDHSHIFDLSHLQSTQAMAPPMHSIHFANIFWKKTLLHFGTIIKLSFDSVFISYTNLKWAWSWNKLKWNPLLCLGVRTLFFGTKPLAVLCYHFDQESKNYTYQIIMLHRTYIFYALVLIINNYYVFFLWICVPYLDQSHFFLRP